MIYFILFESYLAFLNRAGFQRVVYRSVYAESWVEERMVGIIVTNWRYMRVTGGHPDTTIGVRQMAFTLLAERRKPSGEWPVNDAKPAGWRPSATETQSKVSAIGRTAKGNRYARGSII